jgi:hypothetical protein
LTVVALKAAFVAVKATFTEDARTSPKWVTAQRSIVARAGARLIAQANAL